jgi:hypothetical protein
VGSVNFSDAVVSNNSLLEQLMNWCFNDYYWYHYYLWCGFTDSGSRFGDYDNSLTQTRTFTPTTGNAIKVEFTEFATEQDYDFLFI